MHFRDIVRLESDVADEGEIIPDWDKKACIPCGIINTGGGEKIRGKQIEESTKYVVEMRMICGINSGMRLVVMSGPHKSKILNINTVTVVERKYPLRPSLLLIECVSTV